MSSNFVELQRESRKELRYFIALYSLSAFIVALLSTHCAFWAVRAFSDAHSKGATSAESEEAFIEIFGISLLQAELILVALVLTLFFLRSLAVAKETLRGAASVVEAFKARRLEENPADEQERVFINTAHEMAIASGLLTPKLYVLDNEAGINALSIGSTREDQSLLVTKGALQYLSRDQLQGMVAHEMGDLLSGDTRLKALVWGISGGLEALVDLGRSLMRLPFRSGYRGLFLPGKAGEAVGFFLFAISIPIAIAGYMFVLVGALGFVVSNLLRYYIIRKRHLFVDTIGVQNARYAEGLAGALAATLVLPRGSKVSHPAAWPVRFHFFASIGGFRNWLSPLKYHAPILTRIKRIDPAFYVWFNDEREHCRLKDSEVFKRIYSSVSGPS